MHLLDIMQNSVAAKAANIEIVINEQESTDMLSICVSDDGCGMSETFLKQADNPFSTGRTTRRVGLGIPLFKQSAQDCNGHFELESQTGVGTRICARYERSHIDRAPLGNMPDTLITMLLCKGDAQFRYTHIVNDNSFIIDTKQIGQMLEDDNYFNDPEVLTWLRDYAAEGESALTEAATASAYREG